MAMSPDLERAKLFDFTGPVTVNPYHFVTPYPEEESKLDRLMQPFQSEVSPENRKKNKRKQNKKKNVAELSSAWTIPTRIVVRHQRTF